MNAVVLRVRLLAPTAARFLLVSGSSVAVNSLVLWLTHPYLPVVLASAIATEAAIIYCYFGHELWTFRRVNGGKLSFSRFRNYNGLTLVGLLITAGTLQLLVVFTDLHLLLANLIAIATATTCNFTLSHNWAFKAAA